MQINHRKKYFIELNRRNIVFHFRDKGFKIEYNPDGNDSCQISVLVHQMQKKSLYFVHLKQLEKANLTTSAKIPQDNDRFPLIAYVYGFDNWADYC